METIKTLDRDKKQPYPGDFKKSIYQYSDYRLFLADSLKTLQKKNTAYSATAFCRQAGFAGNSRGYFGLIVKGKRNLGVKGVRGFAKALKLSERERIHFENLVAYNQATTEEEKKEAYLRLEKSMRGYSQTYEILSSQYRYFSNWYYVAIRELIGLKNFSQDENWITQKLKNKVTKKQAKKALNDLKILGMVTCKEGKLVQTKNRVGFTDSNLNYTVVNSIHRELLELAKASLESEIYEKRSVSSIIIGTKKENFPKIREEIKTFREELLNKYCTGLNETDTVISMGVQLLFLSQD